MATPAPRYSLLLIIAFALLALGLLRAVLIVVHEPVLGYGDQSDMHRTADCLGIEPIAAPRKPGEMVRPHTLYHTAGFKSAGCYVSSGALMAAPVVLAFGIASIASDEPEILIPLRAFGVFTLSLFAFVALYVALSLRPHPVACVVHATLFFLLVCDPVSTLWLNTLYPEPAALLGAYGAVAFTAVVVLEGGRVRSHWWLLGASLMVLGFAREQFCYLPLALVAVAAPVLLTRSRRKTWTLAGVAAIIAVAQVLLGPLRPDYVSPVNRVNAYLGSILAASSDEEETLDHLGLPSRCAAMSGTTWEARHGEKLEIVCPEVLKISSFAFLKLVPTEPLTLLRVISRVLPAAESIVPGYLGLAAAGPIRSVADLPPRAMSFIALMSKAPSMVFATIVVTLIVAFPVLVWWMVWTIRNEPAFCALPVAFTLLVAIGGYTIATTAFGDSIAGAARHNWLGALATMAAVGLLPLVVWQLSGDILRGRIALAATLGVILLASGWLLWTQHQPLAIGALDKMVEEKGRLLEVSGWALDPWGVRRVYATVGGGPQNEGTRGIERRDLEATYPGYPEAVSGGYQITLASSAWREGELLRVYVESRQGAITEIDRRLIRLRP
ncbi:MAG: hypothetical protein ABI789_05635 [Usitatibacter sp.]